jgi:hypothetical protein
MAAAPPFRFERPDEAILDELVGGYVQITDDPVTRAPKRNLIAACYRVHGENFLPLVLRLFTTTRTATNLLGVIRCLTPIEAVRLLGAASADGLDDEETGGADDREGWLPDLPSSTEGQPDDDPASTHRADQPRSNPGTGFFSEDELGVMARSRTAEALNR